MILYVAYGYDIDVNKYGVCCSVHSKRCHLVISNNIHHSILNAMWPFIKIV